VLGSFASEGKCPDIVINNAGINRRQALEQFSLAQWRELQAANVDGPFLVLRALLPAMKARKSGKIVNLCSLASDLGRPNIVAYAASKGALKMLTRHRVLGMAQASRAGCALGGAARDRRGRGVSRFTGGRLCDRAPLARRRRILCGLLDVQEASPRVCRRAGFAVKFVAPGAGKA